MDWNLKEEHFLKSKKGDSFSSLGIFYYIEAKILEQNFKFQQITLP